MTELLIAGCGYVGSALATHAASLTGPAWGPPWQIWGLRRNAAALPPGIQPIAADLGDPQLASKLPPVRLDYVVICAAAKQADAEAYERVYVQGTANLLQALAARGQRPRRVIFTSSTAVYAQENGEWVDEASHTNPQDYRGQAMLRAEQRVRQTGWPHCIVRLGGIYGPGRTRLIDSVAQGRATWPAGPQYANRIHRDDCAGLLTHLLRHAAPEPMYVGVDCDPADKRAVLTYLHEALGKPLPSSPPPVAANPTGKRCKNDRLRASGYSFHYPSFREGYAALMPQNM